LYRAYRAYRWAQVPDVGNEECPAKGDAAADWIQVLDLSGLFVDRLLGTAFARLTAHRIESLKLLDPSEDQRADLERFVRSAATKPVLVALEELADKEHLWISALRTEGAAQAIQGIELVPWRTNTGRIARWPRVQEQENRQVRTSDRFE
jgi:hypothetical protein